MIKVLRDICVTIVIMASLYFGFYLFEFVSVLLAIVVFLLAAGQSIAYLYYFKIRPMIQSEQVFLALATSHGYEPWTKDEEKASVIYDLHQISGFADYHLSIAQLHGQDLEHSLVAIGKYTTTGSGWEHGYFILVVPKELLRAPDRENEAANLISKELKILRKELFLPLFTTEENLLIDFPSTEISLHRFESDLNLLLSNALELGIR